MITRFYLPLLSTNVKHPKFGCHVTSLCQGLCRSAGRGGEDPENQVGLEVCKIQYAVQLERELNELFKLSSLNAKMPVNVTVW